MNLKFFLLGWREEKGKIEDGISSVERKIKIIKNKILSIAFILNL